MTDAYSDKEGDDDDDEEGKEKDDQDGDYETDSERELFQDSSDGGIGDFLEAMIGYRQAVKAASEGRQFLRTQEGRMALGPGGVVAGDVICVVLGCSTPLVLRPDPVREGEYQLVGASYVHGVMYGEGVRELSQPSTILIS